MKKLIIACCSILVIGGCLMLTSVFVSEGIFENLFKKKAA